MKLWSLFKRNKPQLRSPARPRPAEWDRTIDDLMAEKRTISTEELEWARSYERDKLRAWVRFPRDGEVFEANGEIEVDYLTHWQAPYTGSGKGKLPKGTRVKVSVSQRDPEPIRVYAQPIEYLRFENELVPAAERSAAKYGGFSLSIPVAQLNTDFHLAAT